jgi:CBS domain-containing protein
MERLIMRKPVSAIEQALPRTVTGQTPVREVVEILSSNNIGAVLVCEDGQIEGIFSERDLLLKIGVDYARQSGTAIREFMTAGPVTIEGEDTVAVALNRMDVGDYRHVPITDEAGGNKVKGIISIRDILRYLVDNAN